MRKLTLIGTVLLLALSASTMLADDPAYWQGFGQEIPWEVSPGDTIYPWLQWNGSLVDGTFQGTWWTPSGSDEGGPPPISYIFIGSILYYYTTPGGDVFAHCEGNWCIDPHNGNLKICGTFEMEFNMTGKNCKGFWYPSDSDIVGRMWGTGS